MGEFVAVEAWQVVRLMQQCQEMLAKEEPNMLPLQDIITLCKEVMDYRRHDNGF